MRCPYCDAWTEVKQTRDGVRRRRECANGHRFNTVETVEPERPRQTSPVVAKDPQTMTVVRTFASIKDAASAGFDTGNIQKCLAGKRDQHKGFIWARA